MDLKWQFNKLAADASWAQSGQTIIVAVSTGVDSMVLLDLMRQQAKNHHCHLIVAHVNHELRRQSEQEQTYLENYCARYHLTLAVKHWPAADHPAHGIEAAARAFRYHFFSGLMIKYQAQTLMTAHHADDQAETILMKLVRGGLLEQLQGILRRQSFASGQLVRPLLHFSKQQLTDYACQHRIRWFEDETNTSNTVFRNRLRHHVIPALKRENPELLLHIQQYSEQLTQVLQLAEDRTNELLAAIQLPGKGYSVSQWRMLNAVEQQAVLTAIMQRADLPVRKSYLVESSQLLVNRGKPSGQINLANGKALKKAYDSFSISDALKVTENGNPSSEIVVISNQWVRLPHGQAIRLRPVTDFHALGGAHMALQLHAQELPLRVRSARMDDHLRLASGGHKTVRRLLIDHKIGLEKRQSQLVVVTAQDEILWLIGVQRSARPSGYAKPNYELDLKQTD
ncbi:tRNA lysidine(34) synthetase TilS [Secundilactobacillus folii]|uniref:tRNA(Ile)-lysidine synthase n=1 Tax=Secundilactobacillus folii TaxID=2678357 RepID=A0A7X2XX80_9LACO|nr:tRNA lysidine(34) synthetase TilS [Secundilactobacillus folii]MTV83318.1 tRNA lysidine(34) synthetase TilS [Secundilactobacillus folii]